MASHSEQRSEKAFCKVIRAHSYRWAIYMYVVQPHTQSKRERERERGKEEEEEEKKERERERGTKDSTPSSFKQRSLSNTKQ